MLSFKFINIDGNASNFDTLSTTLAAMAHDFTVIGVAKTNVESGLKDLYSIPGYELIYQDKMCRKKKGSGVAMYVHKDINFVHNKEMSVLTSDIEALFISILALTRKICGILSKKLQKLALLKLLSNLSVKTTVFCYFFDIPQILQV